MKIDVTNLVKAFKKNYLARHIIGISCAALTLLWVIFDIALGGDYNIFDKILTAISGLGLFFGVFVWMDSMNDVVDFSIKLMQDATDELED